MRAPKPPDSTAECETRDAGHGHNAASGRQADCLRLAVEFGPRHAGLGSRCPACRVHADALHQRQIDHETAVADATPGRAVTASTHRYEQAVFAGEVHGGYDIGSACALDN